MTHRGVEISYWHGATVTSQKTDTPNYWVASTLGSFVTGKNITGRDDAMKHEFGHYIQSRKWGPLYLFVFAIPSVLSFALRKSKHEKFYTERNANEESSKWFPNK